MDENGNYLEETKLESSQVEEQPQLEAVETANPEKNEASEAAEQKEAQDTSANVMDFMRRYNENQTDDGETVTAEKIGISGKVGFDKMTQDEQADFMQKLKLLTITNQRQKFEKVDVCQNYRRNNNRNFGPSNNNYSRRGNFGMAPPGRNVLDVLVGQQQQQQRGYARRGGVSSTKDIEKPFQRRQMRNLSPRKNNGAQLNRMDFKDKKRYVDVMAQEYDNKMAKECGKTKFSVPKPFNKAQSGRVEKWRSASMTSTDTAAPDVTALDDGKLTNDKMKAWEGELPPRDYKSPVFSRKIFVGGVPWDITENALQDSFSEFGRCIVEWPGQEARYTKAPAANSPKGKITGYVYMIYDDERSVGALLRECSQEMGGAGEWYFKIRAQRSKSTEIRQVQIIPWVTSDSMHVIDEKDVKDFYEPKRTVFVGALHGMMTAQVLHSIMEDVFGNVECVQLDTDKFKYPIGSGRVTFRTHNAYFNAIDIGFLEVHTSKFKKRVQIDPFLEESTCMRCNTATAIRFCRHNTCFKYYCDSCWNIDHGNGTDNALHMPVVVPSAALKSASATSVGGRTPQKNERYGRGQGSNKHMSPRSLASNAYLSPYLAGRTPYHSYVDNHKMAAGDASVDSMSHTQTTTTADNSPVKYIESSAEFSPQKNYEGSAHKSSRRESSSSSLMVSTTGNVDPSQMKASLSPPNPLSIPPGYKQYRSYESVNPFYLASYYYAPPPQSNPPSSYYGNYVYGYVPTAGPLVYDYVNGGYAGAGSAMPPPPPHVLAAGQQNLIHPPTSMPTAIPVSQPYVYPQQPSQQQYSNYQ